MEPQCYLISTLNLRVLKKWAILTALHKHNQNRTKAAKELGISVRSIRNWIKDMRETINQVSH